jgi:signal transduction histidine kinase/CheY-like chemotaxis protein
MVELADKFQLNIRVSPKPLLIVIGLVGFIFVIFAVASAELSKIILYDLLAVGFFLLAGWGWVLQARYPDLTRWLISGVFVTFLIIPWLLFGFSDQWALLFVPVALSAMLLGLAAGLLVAGAETIFVLLVYASGLGGSALFAASNIAGAWLFCLFYWWSQKPLRETAQWSWFHWKDANRKLEEVHHNRQRYEESLKDLADANLQMRALNRLAQNLRHVAENARAAKEQFVANVSHELRTPLNMITGYTEMILNTPGMYGRKIPGALLADLSVIQRNAEHLTRLINDVLDLSQVEADQMALFKEHVNVQEVVEFTLAAVQPLYRLKQLTLNSEIQAELPLVFCDRTRMQEVLLNILSNAGRFTEKGGVEVRVWKDSANLCVSIRDSGPGIAKENIQRLFTPFEQLDASIRRQYGGTGLGLAISKRFIEMHDGRIWVESQEGEGTTIFFAIPLGVVSPQAHGAARWFNPHQVYETPDHLPKLPKASLPRFLVVERGAVLTNLLTRYLNRVEIEHAPNLEGAKLLSEKAPVQAILLNTYHAPETLAALQAGIAFDKSLPILACSVPGFEEEVDQMNVADILIKPIHRDRLLEALSKLGVKSGSILIVDDEPDALHLFARMLTSTEQDYQVLTARDGLEALNILKDYRPDAILLDLVMPNLNGFQLLEMRDTHPELQGIPIIVISARDPAGHSIVSDSLTVALQNGFSARQLLGCIEALSRILSSANWNGDPELPAGSRG